jgi:hypothetical protein
MKRKLLLIFIIIQIALLSTFFLIPMQAYANGGFFNMYIFADFNNEPQNFLLFADDLDGDSYTFNITGTASYSETGTINGSNWTKIITLNLSSGNYNATFFVDSSPDAMTTEFTVGEKLINLEVDPGTACSETNFNFEASWPSTGGYQFSIDKIILNPFSITNIFQNTGAIDSYPWQHSESYSLDKALYVAYAETDITSYYDYELFNIPGCGKKEVEPVVEEPEWIRSIPMTCYQVWVNDNGCFEFVFWYEYKDNNWVKIYDMAGNEVFSIDMPYGKANFKACLADGMYTVKTYHVDMSEPLQEFVIAK